MYNRCYGSESSFLSSKESQPFHSEADTARAGRHGALSDGGGFFYGAKAEAGWSCGVLSFSLGPRGEPTSLCSQRGGGVLAEAGLSLAEVYEGHGLLGKGESGDREGVERDRPAAVRAITGREAGVKEGLIVFKENKVEVRERLKDGRIDYLDLTSWSFQDRLFGFLIEERFFEWCGSSYPTPRQRENIPVWFLLACGIQMKLHRSAAFRRLTYILRSGSVGGNKKDTRISRGGSLAEMVK